MTENKEIRWKQRFINFNKAFSQLDKAVDIVSQLDDLAKEGLIQRFEYTLELAWKTLKDYLESKGVIAIFPKDVIRQAFQTEIIENGELWMEMLQERNLLSHTYNEEIFRHSIDKIVNSYFAEIEKLHFYLKNEQ